MLQPMESQRVENNLLSEQQHLLMTDDFAPFLCLIYASHITSFSPTLRLRFTSLVLKIEEL